jgi:hypothetical protein
MAADTGDLDDLDRQIASVMDCNPLSEDEVVRLCDKTKGILQGDPNVPNVAAPVTVVGDIHGQFYDLLELFRIGGKVSAAPKHPSATEWARDSVHASAGPPQSHKGHSYRVDGARERLHTIVRSSPVHQPGKGARGCCLAALLCGAFALSSSPSKT